MYRISRPDLVRRPYLTLWSILAFQAGFINAFGFIACGRYVSHVTGFGTQIGVALAEHRVFQAFELLGFPLSFIFGAFVNGALTAARLERGLRPRFDRVTLILPAMIFAIWFLGRDGDFGAFSEPLLLPRDFMLLFALSFVCGMQNACFAVITHGQIRTTHLTGISTDIGTDTARLWFGQLKPEEYALTLRTNISRITTLLTFTSGSVVSIWISQRWEYDALLLPGTLAVIVFVLVQLWTREIELKDARAASQAAA